MRIPKIILVDDHQIFRKGIKSLISIEKMGIVIGEASDGNEFIDLLSKLTPDLVLMDIDMPNLNGIETTMKALGILPEIKIIAVTQFANEDYLIKMIEIGAIGFILKSAGIHEFEKAIKVCFKGEKYFSINLSERNVSNFRH